MKPLFKSVLRLATNMTRSYNSSHGNDLSSKNARRIYPLSSFKSHERKGRAQNSTIGAYESVILSQQDSVRSTTFIVKTVQVGVSRTSSSERDDIVIIEGETRSVKDQIWARSKQGQDLIDQVA